MTAARAISIKLCVLNRLVYQKKHVDFTKILLAKEKLRENIERKLDIDHENEALIVNDSFGRWQPKPVVRRGLRKHECTVTFLNGALSSVSNFMPDNAGQRRPPSGPGHNWVEPCNRIRHNASSGPVRLLPVWSHET